MTGLIICDICERTNRTVYFKIRRKFSISKWIKLRYNPYWGDLDVCDECLEGIYEYIAGRNSAKGLNKGKGD